MKISILLTLILVSFSIKSQDVIPTNDGELKVFPILHGTVAFEWNGMTIYVDPYGGSGAFSAVGDPDIILITDIHGDHLNTKTLEELNTSNVQLFAPQAVFEKLDEGFKAKTTVINNGESVDFKGLNITAIPMYNLPDDETSRHKKGRGNGYILTIGGKRIYLSGDTEDIPEMRALKNIDVAFVCMNLPYTMSIKQASSAVSEFKPSIVYPYHYRGSGGLSDVEGFKLLVNKTAPEVEVRLRDWYPAN